MNSALRPGVEAASDPAARATAIPVSVRLWQAVAAAQAALAVSLETDGGACPVLAVDAFAVLLSLADEPGQQLRMHELAERSHLTPSGLTRRVDRLESDGLVDRVGCPGDRRGAFARITPRGLDELQRALPHHAGVLARHIAPRLDEPEADALIALLRDLAGGPRPPVEPGRVVDPPTLQTADRGR